MSYRREHRPGWVRPCPKCGRAIKYTKLIAWTEALPYMYSEFGNDVLLRQKDIPRISSLLRQNDLDDRDLLAAWQAIERTAPAAPHGGRFSLWANIKCPHCGYEFPYNEGIRDVRRRSTEAEVILIDGAIVIGDDHASSWVAVVDV